jgi:RNA polymerase sigma-70 factor (ECF subfamily)
MEEDDLERLYTRLERRLANVVYRWVWNIDEAQEIVQEAFVRLWRMRARVDLSTVEPLVYRIALNLASSRRRSKRLWQWVSLEAVRERASLARATDESMAGEEDAARLRAAVEALPEDLRRVIVMCELSEMSYQAIAEALSIPAGTVGSRRHRALARLRQALAEPEVKGDIRARTLV